MRTGFFWPRCPLSPFSSSSTPWTVNNGAIGQQTFEVYAAYILGQHTNILAHSNLRPFAGNIEGFEDGASEDDCMMGGDLIYPMSPPPSYPHHHTPNTLRPTPCNLITLPTNLILLNKSYHPPLALGLTPTPTPWPIVFTLTLPPLLPLRLPPHPQTRQATDRKAIRKTRKARHRLRLRQGPLTPTSLLPLCLALPNCTSIASHFHGWVTTHGWPSGNGDHHGDPCIRASS